MPWENGRKRRYSDVMEDPYRGPPEFMEAGVRGFLVTSVPDREEHAIDEAVKCLRKACVKLYGGIRPLKREDASFAKGYVMIDFMDPEAVIPLPNPDAEKAAAEEKEKQAAEAAKEAEKESEAMEEEAKKAEEAAEKDTANPDENKGEAKEGGEEGDAKTKEEKEKEEQKKKEELKKKRREEEERLKPPLMLAPHKFKSFRTELRNIMFIKADVADPVEVVNTVFDLILERKPLLTDCINQLLPIQGVCDNDYKQLEIMCRRVLAPYVGEHLEEPPSFAVMLIDKMSEPGAEILLEVVRSAIWCLNPQAWQSSAVCEPDIVIHLEIIGSKVILSVMTHYMKYRHYSPFALHEMGTGKPEDEEVLLREIEKREERERERAMEREKGGRKKKRGGEKKKDKKAAAEAKKKEEEGEAEKQKDEETKEEKGEGETEEVEKEEETKEDNTQEHEEEEPTEQKASSEGKKSSRTRSSGEKKSKS